MSQIESVVVIGHRFIVESESSEFAILHRRGYNRIEDHENLFFFVFFVVGVVEGWCW